MANRLVDAHITAQERIRAMVVRGVEALWAQSGYDEKDVDPFLSVVLPLVLRGQALSAALTDAFLARSLRRQPIGVPLDSVSGAAVRNGTPPAEVYRRPFVTVWTALAAGTAWQDAVHAGLERATATAAMDVQLTHFATYQAVQDADPGIRGYQRVADGGACPFCLSVDGAFVKSADASPLHNRCGCGLEPVLYDVKPTPLPDDVAVHDHGELGPVLGSPDHSFIAL